MTFPEAEDIRGLREKIENVFNRRLPAVNIPHEVITEILSLPELRAALPGREDNGGPTKEAWNDIKQIEKNLAGDFEQPTAEGRRKETRLLLDAIACLERARRKLNLDLLVAHGELMGGYDEPPPTSVEETVERPHDELAALLAGKDWNLAIEAAAKIADASAEISNTAAATFAALNEHDADPHILRHRQAGAAAQNIAQAIRALSRPQKEQ